MLIKTKICAGWDGKPHSAFIYKNIKGKKYCRECAYRLSPPKQIKKSSTKREDKELSDKQMKLFLEIWNERAFPDGSHYCEVSGEKLGYEPLSMYFDHLLEKSKYPQLRFDKRNIILISTDMHSRKTNGFPCPVHKDLIDKAKAELLP